MHAKRPVTTFSFKTPPHIVIVEARYYSDIADLQIQGVTEVLARAQATHEIITVPGALEIPAAIGFYVDALDADLMRKRADGFIALGCVIKGGTSHDQIVGFESAHGLQELALRHRLAIGNGILTCNSMEQVLERADPARFDKGGKAAEACLRMIELKRSLVASR